MIEGVTCVVLVGGESRRMGSDKASLQLNGKSLLERVLDVVRPLFDDIYIGAHAETAIYEGARLEILKDTLPGRGPALGICAALEKSDNKWVFVVSCDLPGLSREVVSYMATLLDDFDVVVPRLSGGLETTCAFYSIACLVPLTKRVLDGRRGLRRFIEGEELKVRYVEEDELLEVDPNLKSFADIDTPEEFNEAKENY